MRKILFGVLGCLVAVCAHAAQIVNVDYIHKLIAQEWDISIPIKADSPMHVANMKYLLTAVDVANEILNGEKTTDYGNGEFATLQIADTVATNTAVETLVRKEIEYKFFLTTTSTNSFSFSISAAGEFIVNWGDGKTETITKPDTTNTTYSHTYSTSKSYTIKLTGQATAYNTSTSTAAISFYVGSNTSAKETNVKKIASIDGSLGAIFGTLSSDTNNQPRFYQTFYKATNMKGAIPSDLFAGISGAPASRMFYSTFKDCSGLTGAIPNELFGDLYGAPAFFMFDSTFSGCSGLTGAIPDGLFGNLTGAPARGMFGATFSGCSGLTGAIPDGLFGNLTGAPAELMFYSTFEGCSGLTSIPENLFGNISGTAQDGMFSSTFKNCTSLTGPSAKINGKYIYEIWPETDQYGNGFMYTNCKKLSDYMYMPTMYGGMGVTDIEYVSAPDNVDYKFFVTTIPDVDLFAISIAAAGDFYIDWGDGAKQKITKTDTTKYDIGHKYANSGQYTIGIGGQATAYNTNSQESTIKISYYIQALEANYFDGDGPLNYIASIDGSLGAIFGKLADGSQPRFYETFSDASNMTGSIPSDLFAGISGAPASYMFASTFSGCSGLTGAIPDGLFGNLSGAPASYMFAYTFYGCRGLTSIPAGLFAGISGAPASYMFAYTFYGCSGLTSIPSDLFAGISGAPASYMFNGTFEGCSGLTGAIPDGLFAGISDVPAGSMFQNTFSGCSGLTSIPDGLFAGISGAPAYNMFRETFSGCSGLTSIPENLFGNISGTAQSNMFRETFYNCTSLTGPSARINGQYLYEIWPSATSGQVGDMYYKATGLSDYSSIPSAWK